MDNRKIKTEDVIKFLLASQDNWIITDKDGYPLRHPNGDIKVYSNLTDILADYDKKSGQLITTEYSAIMGAMQLYKDVDDYETAKYY